MSNVPKKSFLHYRLISVLTRAEKKFSSLPTDIGTKHNSTYYGTGKQPRRNEFPLL
jgi:hypothetical protein